jgi:hypothetical protein
VESETPEILCGVNVTEFILAYAVNCCILSAKHISGDFITSSLFYQVEPYTPVYVLSKAAAEFLLRTSLSAC